MLKDLRKQVCEANRDLERYRLLTLTWGNASGIDRTKGLVVIKPSGVAYANLTPDKLVVLDLEGKTVEGRLNPSSDAPTHLVLYRAFASIGGIAHTHSTHATSFAQACRAIPCLGTTQADHFYGPVPVTRRMTTREVRGDYEANTGRVIVERFAKLSPIEMPGVLVANHGPFTWGKDAAEAVKNSVILEAVAQMALGTYALAPGIRAIQPSLLDKHFQRKHGPSAYYGQKPSR